MDFWSLGGNQTAIDMDFFLPSTKPALTQAATVRTKSCFEPGASIEPVPWTKHCGQAPGR